MGSMETRALRYLIGRDEYPLPSDSDIGRIAGTYHAWRGEAGAGEYSDVPGFCKSATPDDIRKRGHALTPGRYVDSATAEDDAEPFEERMQRLATTLSLQRTEAAKLNAAIEANLKELGYCA
jgi:type I restriction enzyme M protein